METLKEKLHNEAVLLVYVGRTLYVTVDVDSL